MDITKLLKNVTTSLLALVVLCSSCQPQVNDKKLIIAAASNTQFAIKKIIDNFEKQSQIDCELILSSSGKITAQIMEGAPYDVFLSADEKYPQTLFENKLATAKPKVYAEGALVLWTVNPHIELILETLLADDIEHIAIANPKTAPYGRAAQEVLVSAGLFDKVEAKLVYGESISQAERFVTSGAADLGFTTKAILKSGQLEDKIRWLDIPKSMHSPITQAAILINRKGEVSEEAKRFYTYLFSKEAEMVLKDFGYSIGE